MTQALFPALYAIDVSVCLLAIKKKSTPVYAATKPLLMPLLCIVYFCLLPVELRNQSYQRFVIGALSLHALGDLFLLFPRNKTKKFFYLGMVCFFLGHLFYSSWFLTAPVGHTKKWSIIVFMLCFLLEYLLYRQLILGPRKYAPILLPYSFGLCVVGISIASTIGQGSPAYATVISFMGIMLFFFSDFCILRRLVRLPLFGQMTVMTTYIAGQTMIVLGMLLMQVKP